MKKLILIALFALSTLSAQAQDIPQTQYPALIQKTEAYLNGITTLQARFAQTNSDATVDTGLFSMWRPGRLRFQYDAPKKDYIVADGLLVHYWDDTSKDYSNAPIGSTLADFLLRKKIKLSGDIKVTSIRRPAENKLVITVAQKDNPDGGDLRLLFTENPMRLDKWRVTDATGQITEVTLSNVQTGIKLNPTLFRFKPPKGFDQDWQNTR